MVDQPSGTNPMHPKCLHHIGTSTPRAARQQKNKSHLHSTLNYTRHENIRSSYWNPTTIYIWENKLKQVLANSRRKSMHTFIIIKYMCFYLLICSSILYIYLFQYVIYIIRQICGNPPNYEAPILGTPDSASAVCLK